MSAAPTPESFPGREQIIDAEPDVTADDIINDLTNIALQDQKFADGERSYVAENPSWANPDGVDWSMRMKILEDWDITAGQTDGLLFEVGLEVLYEPSKPRYPRELKKLDDEDPELPDPTKVISMEICYSALYTLRSNGQLGWQVSRRYALNEIVPIEVSSDDDDDDKQGVAASEPTAGLELPKTAVVESGYVRNVANYMPLLPHPDNSEEIAQEAADPMLAFDRELRLRELAHIIEMLIARDEGDFDLRTIFPIEVLDAEDLPDQTSDDEVTEA